MAISKSALRVQQHTPKHINERIRSETEQSIAYYGSRPEMIPHRLDELDREWDIERAIEAFASGVLLFSMLHAIVLRKRRWMLMLPVVSGFLMQHAIQGWCPPVSVLRRLGFRTEREIEEERYALKALRGDFKELPQAEPAQRDKFSRLVEAVR